MDFDSRHLRIFHSERLGRKLIARDHAVWKPDDIEI
jgi:hypothetical protein